jgi:hypothetical protein|tara:strand:- start:3476 stop:3847 length:372 start_codon:yes stop_codon:yes gene_type:complete
MSDDKFFTDDNLAQSNWMKFDKVGDKCKGVLIGQSRKEGRDGFAPQAVYELQQEDGSVLNVGISEKKDFVINRMKQAKMGDIVGFLFKEEIETAKGFHPAKSIIVYIKAGEGVEEAPEEPDFE